MKKLPDIRKEVQPFFDAVKNMLVDRVKEGKPPFPPLHMFATLTLYAQHHLNQPSQIVLVPDWQGPEQKAHCIAQFVTFLNKYCESAILCGGGYGTHSGFGKNEVMYVFATQYMPGYEPWTLAQLYTAVEKEVIFDAECCSSDGNVEFFDLPGLWPKGVPPV